MRNCDHADEVAQEVFAKVYFSIRNFDFRSSLITWIYKITVNECFDYLRKKKVRKLVYESDMSEDEVRRVENSEPALDRGARADSTLARRDYVVKLMDRVSDEEKQLLMLKEVEGYSVEDIVAKLGYAPRSVKRKLHLIRELWERKVDHE